MIPNITARLGPYSDARTPKIAAAIHVTRTTRTPQAPIFASPSACVHAIRIPDSKRLPAISASTTWKSASDRKLNRNIPALGIMQIPSTTASSANSHRSFAKTGDPAHCDRRNHKNKRHEPLVSSIATMRLDRLAKQRPATVHDGRINPGNALNGTVH
jgi:hypothetical protein